MNMPIDNNAYESSAPWRGENCMRKSCMTRTVGLFAASRDIDTTNFAFIIRIVLWQSIFAGERLSIPVDKRPPASMICDAVTGVSVSLLTENVSCV